MHDFKKETIRRIRMEREEVRGFLDEEIERVYSLYCEMFHAASWTRVDMDDFIDWATKSPLDRVKGK